MKRVYRLLLSLIGLFLAWGLLLGLDAYVQPTSIELLPPGTNAAIGGSGLEAREAYVAGPVVIGEVVGAALSSIAAGDRLSMRSSGGVPRGKSSYSRSPASPKTIRLVARKRTAGARLIQRPTVSAA